MSFNITSSGGQNGLTQGKPAGLPMIMSAVTIGHTMIVIHCYKPLLPWCQANLKINHTYTVTTFQVVPGTIKTTAADYLVYFSTATKFYECNDFDARPVVRLTPMANLGAFNARDHVNVMVLAVSDDYGKLQQPHKFDVMDPSILRLQPGLVRTHEHATT